MTGEFIDIHRLIFYAFLWSMLAIMMVGPWMCGFTDRKNANEQ